MPITDLLVPLLTLVFLEVILGIDNVIFISILSDKVEESKRRRLRNTGLILAMVIRLVLLSLISWIMQLQEPLFNVVGQSISGKDLILLFGGTFLIYKSTVEIYHKTEGQHTKTEEKTQKTAKFKDMLIQILLLDIVFSVDSIITAVGMVQQVWIMYAAVIISVLIMLLSAKSIADFINRHPSFKILALSFLMVIGVSLVAEGMHYHLPKGYIYFAMAFSFLVDLLQLRAQKHESR
jgi:predicted tellurium resistance membrane protein TerC